MRRVRSWGRTLVVVLAAWTLGEWVEDLLVGTALSAPQHEQAAYLAGLLTMAAAIFVMMRPDAGSRHKDQAPGETR